MTGAEVLNWCRIRNIGVLSGYQVLLLCGRSTLVDCLLYEIVKLSAIEVSALLILLLPCRDVICEQLFIHMTADLLDATAAKLELGG